MPYQDKLHCMGQLWGSVSPEYKKEKERISAFSTLFLIHLENQAGTTRLRVNRFKISKCAPSLRRSPKEIPYLVWFTCIPPICKHTRRQTAAQCTRCPLCGWIPSWGYRPRALYSRVKTRERRQQSTCHGSQSGWKDSSLFPQSSCHTVQSCRRSFTDFKSPDIVPSITGHRCHESRWILSIYAVKVRAVKTYSERVFDGLTFSTELSEALLDADVPASERPSVHVTRCARAVINTPLPLCQMKAWKMVWSKGKKRVCPSPVVALVIWSIPCNYRDLCRPAFQDLFVSQPPVEIRSVFNSSHTEERSGERTGELQ